MFARIRITYIFAGESDEGNPLMIPKIALILSNFILASVRIPSLRRFFFVYGLINED